MLTIRECWINEWLLPLCFLLALFLHNFLPSLPATKELFHNGYNLSLQTSTCGLASWLNTLRPLQTNDVGIFRVWKVMGIRKGLFFLYYWLAFNKKWISLWNACKWNWVQNVFVSVCVKMCTYVLIKCGEKRRDWDVFGKVEGKINTISN